MSPNTLGALLMMASMASFTINDALIKLTGGALPLWELLFLRGIMTSVMVLGLAIWLKGLRWRMARGDTWRVAWRCAAEIGASYCFVTSLLNMPLANVGAILQMLPLTVSLAAALFLSEPLGWRRMLAILIGFMGMFLIVRPGAEGFSGWSFYALGAVACVTLRDLVTRRLSAEVPSMTVTLAAAVSITLFSGLASLTGSWAPVTADLWKLLAGSAVFILGGYFFSVQVMRQGEIAFVAPFRYTSLLWALGLGWFVFGDWPDALTFLGAAIIVATGLFTFYRESQRY